MAAEPPRHAGNGGAGEGAKLLHSLAGQELLGGWLAGGISIVSFRHARDGVP